MKKLLLSQPWQQLRVRISLILLNGEIMYALSYARTGEKQEWTSADIEAWKKSVHGKTAVPGFGTTGHNTADDDKSLIFIGEVFDDQSRVCLVDHNAPSQMVAPLKKKIIEEGKTDMLVGIIDHHALDENIYTKGPLFMDIRPWGSMSTIIWAASRRVRFFPTHCTRFTPGRLR